MAKGDKMNGEKGGTGKTLVRTANLSIAKLYSDHNARKEIGGIDELAESMRTSGQVVPIVTTEMADGSFRIEAGHRRVEAAKKLGWTEIRAEVWRLEESGEAERRFRAMAENVGRKSLKPWEIVSELATLKKITDDAKLLMSGDALGARVGLDGKSVNNYLRIAKSVHPPILKEWAGSQPVATVGEMLMLAALKDSEEQIRRWKERNKGGNDPNDGDSPKGGKEGRKPPVRTVKKAEDIRAMRDKVEQSKGPQKDGMLAALKWVLGESADLPT